MGKFLDNDPELQAIIGGTPTASSTSILSGFNSPYDGASQVAREVALWNPIEGSADQEMLGDKPILDARSRDMMRNDAFVQSGANMQKDHIVGSQYLLNSKPNHTALGLDEVWAKEFQEEVESKFTLAANSINCWFDAGRKNTFSELIRLAVAVHMAGGEVLASSEWIRDPIRPFNTAIQMIDVERLSTPAGMIENRFLRSGIVKDKYGAPLAYHIRKSHPNEWYDGENYKWDLVPTYKPWGRKVVEHIFEQNRPDQTRSVGMLASALSELKITKQFRKTAIQRQIMDASFAASIESELPTDAVYAAMGAGASNPQQIQEAISAYSKGFLSSVNQYSGSKGLKIDGVRIPHFHPGTKLNVRPVGHGGPLGTDFEKSLLRYLAASMGISYEQLSKDFSDSNYSNFKAASNETYRRMMSLKKMVADRVATWIFNLWLEEMLAKGMIDSLPKNAPNFYERLNREAYTSCEWIGADRGQVDELKETQAAVIRLHNCLSTHEEELGRRGKDYRKVFIQREQEIKEMKERGIEINPADNSINALSASEKTRAPRDSKTGGKDVKNAA